jgi:hypothetical protein
MIAALFWRNWLSNKDFRIQQKSHDHLIIRGKLIGRPLELWFLDAESCSFASAPS